MFSVMRRHGKRMAFGRLLAFVVAACAIHSGCASQMARSPYVKSYVDGQDFAAALEEIDTVRELRRDPNLTERQRDMLVEIYETFLTANRARRE